MSKSSLPIGLKIALVYCFAVAGAMVGTVSCGKMEARTATIKGAVQNGTGATVTQGNTGEVFSGGSLAIQKIETVFLGAEDAGPNEMQWSLKVQYTHGNRRLTADLFPSVNPIGGSTSYHIDGDTSYRVTGICGDVYCSKYAVMIDIENTTTGVSGQRVEYWDQLLSTVQPQGQFTDTAFTSIIQAYEAASRTKLNL